MEAAGAHAKSKIRFMVIKVAAYLSFSGRFTGSFMAAMENIAFHIPLSKTKKVDVFSCLLDKY